RSLAFSYSYVHYHVFYLSSRRRHTISKRDWSSDVCLPIFGINVAIATRTEGNVGLGFAIPVDYAQRVAQELIENGEATHGMLGVSIVPAGDQNVSSGARVLEIVEDGPAAGANLETDDVIVGIDDKSVTDPGSLSATVSEYPADSEVELTVVRDGEEFTETLQLGSME